MWDKPGLRQMDNKFPLHYSSFPYIDRTALSSLINSLLCQYLHIMLFIASLTCQFMKVKLLYLHEKQHVSPSPHQERNIGGNTGLRDHPNSMATNHPKILPQILSISFRCCTLWRRAFHTQRPIQKSDTQVLNSDLCFCYWSPKWPTLQSWLGL